MDNLEFIFKPFEGTPREELEYEQVSPEVALLNLTITDDIADQPDAIRTIGFTLTCNTYINGRYEHILEHYNIGTGTDIDINHYFFAEINGKLIRIMIPDVFDLDDKLMTGEEIEDLNYLIFYVHRVFLTGTVCGDNTNWCLGPMRKNITTSITFNRYDEFIAFLKQKGLKQDYHF